jgi:hypothetical protein
MDVLWYINDVFIVILTIKKQMDYFALQLHRGLNLPFLAAIRDCTLKDDSPLFREKSAPLAGNREIGKPQLVVF